MVEQVQIQGRGGASFTYLRCEQLSHEFIIAAGASRECQFNDFWKVTVAPIGESFKVTTQSLPVKNEDGFGPRNSVVSALSPTDGKVYLFGGQDSENDQQFDEMFVFDYSTNEIKQVTFAPTDDSIPVKRNAHTICANNQFAYIFGGANSDGPLSDLHEFEFKTQKFKRIKLDQTSVQLPAIEMHTSHLFQSKYLIILGGRALPQGGSLNEIQFSSDIYQIDLESGKVSMFGTLPSAIGSHVSFIVDDKYLVLYGGTNGFRFFDSILRYEISIKKWTLMTQQPESLKASKFVKDGRIACSACQVSNSYAVLFGGCSAEQDEGDFLILNFTHIREDINFSEITEIM